MGRRALEGASRVSWVAAFVGFSLLIVLHELGHFAAAKWVGMRVEKFSLFFGKPLVSTRRGETLYAVGWIPLGGYVKISGMNPHEELPEEVAGRAYFRQPVWKRLVVIGAGPLVNLVLAFVIFWLLFWSTPSFVSNNRVENIDRGSPAAGVLQRGDRIVAVDGKTGDLGVLSGQIARHRCPGMQKDGCKARSPAELTIERDGQTRTVEVTPRYDAEVKRPRVGFGYGGEFVDLGPAQAADKSVGTMWDVTSATVGVIVRLFYSPEARDEVSGVVGSYEQTRESFNIGIRQAVLILGLISLSLAVVNLFPLLPLDGGHIFWALAEKVRGRAIPFAVMERASVIGLVLIALLFVIGLENDIDRLRSGEI
jgi:regulator of sigma E protease